MRRRLVVGALAAAIVAFAALVAPQPAGAGARERWAAAFKNAKDARASFHQTRDAGALGKTVNTGTLEFRAPANVRVDYAGSVPMTILLRGDTAWVYQPTQKQVLKSSARASGVPPLPFLTGEPGRLDERYRVEEKGKDTIVFTPKDGAALSWSACELAIDPSTGLPRQALVRLSDGSTIALAFQRFRVNAGVAAARFRTPWPAGTPVVAL
jgi:outer membrane lipoprotein-sorting protein